MTRIRRATLVAACTLCAAFAVSAPASTLWTRGWTTPMPPTFTTRLSNPPELRGVAFAEGGDILIGSLSRSGYDEQVTRFGADGTLRWSANVASYADAAELVPTADGGAYATFLEPGSADGYAARIDNAGRLVWARDVPAIWLAEVPNGRVVVADCLDVSMLDAALGDVLWQRTLKSDGYCVRGGLAVDADSNVYAVATTQDSGTAAHTRVVKFDAAGATIWEQRFDTDVEAAILGLGDGRLYVRDDDTVIALDSAGGSQVWRVTGEGQLLAGAANEPIVVADGAIERLRAADGSVAWSVPMASGAAPVSAVGGAIMALGADGLVRIDAETGAVAWTAQLPTGSAWTTWAGFGGLAGGAFTAVGNDGREAFVQRIDFASGAMLPATDVPAVDQGVYGYSAKLGADVVGIAVMTGVGLGGQDLRVRSVDGTTGAVRWESATSLQDDWMNLTAYSFYAREAGGSASIVAAIPLNYGTGYESNDSGAVRVVSYDRASGSENWNVVLVDMGQGYTSLADLVVDADDNVFVAVGTTFPCNMVDICEHQTVYKLAAADGSVLWRDDRDFGGAFGPVDPPSIRALGADLLVAPSVSGPYSNVRRLASADGSETWSSDIFATEGVLDVHAVDASHVVAFALTDGTFHRWAGLDASTGATLWTKTKPCPGTCSGYGGTVAPDGDVLLPAASPDAAPELARVHDDGSGDVDVWQVADTRDDLLSYTDMISFDEAGKLWLSVVRLGSSMGSGSWYGIFDTASGSLLSSQALPGGAFAPPSGGNVLTGWNPPGGPTETGVALVNATLSATGNLAAALTIDRARVMSNVEVGFDLEATYDGDAPIAGVRLTGRMPWPSGATDLVCAGPGVSNCTIDATGRDVHATFDIAPGSTIHVTGRIRVLDIAASLAPTRTFGLNVRGPEALGETDTVDNFASARVTQSLFAGDFDSN